MKISEDMKDVIRKTHKYSTIPWTSTFDFTYIGYGHRITTEAFDKKISKAFALLVLEKDLERIEMQVSSLFTKDIPQHHFDVFCHIVYDFSYKAFKNSRLYLKYNESIIRDIVLKDSMIPYIMIWSKIKGHYSKAMAYRRQTDTNIYTSLDYRIKQ
jgi:GH24 family phage-related lysozyme (muramidase)